MHSSVVILVLALICVHVISGQWYRPTNHCNTNSDCSASSYWFRRADRVPRCCVSRIRPIGKRAISFRPQQSRGTCQDFGEDRDSCLVRNEGAKVDPKGNFFVACPCRDGYTCVGSGVFDIPLGEVGTCQKEKTGPRVCKKNSDCGYNECCVEPDFRRGKRQIGGVQNTCQPLGEINSKCFPGRPDRDPQLGVCPCGPNLICNPDGGREVPQGFTGKCAPGSIGPKPIGK